MRNDKFLCKVTFRKIDSRIPQSVIGEVDKNQLIPSPNNLNRFINIKNGTEKTIFKADIKEIIIYKEYKRFSIDMNDFGLNYIVVNNA